MVSEVLLFGDWMLVSNCWILLQIVQLLYLQAITDFLSFILGIAFL
jgi:hypothetical protein